jgi:hypothetical protein
MLLPGMFVAGIFDTGISSAVFAALTGALLLPIGYYYASSRKPEPFLNQLSKVLEPSRFTTKLTTEEAMKRLQNFDDRKVKTVASNSSSLVLSQPGDPLTFGLFYTVNIQPGQYHITTVTVSTHPKIYQRGFIVKSYQKKITAELERCLLS